MKILYFPINRLKESPYNPRRMSDEDKDSLRCSLKEFGLTTPLLVNKSYYVIGGNQRLKVLKELGTTIVPVVVIDLPARKEKALCVALNKISGDWDDEKLADILSQIDKQLMPSTGFSKSELERLQEHYDYSDLSSEVESLQAEESKFMAWESNVSKKDFVRYVEPVLTRIKKSHKMECFTSAETNGLILVELCKSYPKSVPM